MIISASRVPAFVLAGGEGRRLRPRPMAALLRDPAWGRVDASQDVPRPAEHI